MGEKHWKTRAKLKTKTKTNGVRIPLQQDRQFRLLALVPPLALV